MNWFDKMLDEWLRPLLKIAAWATVAIALFNEVSYLHHSNAIYMVLLVAAVAWLLLIEPALDLPSIYFVKEKQMFMYAKGNQRIAFDFVTLIKKEDGRGLVGDINDLYITRQAVLGEGSYLVFDADNHASAILPHQRWYGTNESDAKIVLVKLDGSKTRMSIGDFMKHQEQILHDAKAATAK